METGNPMMRGTNETEATAHTRAGRDRRVDHRSRFGRMGPRALRLIDRWPVLADQDIARVAAGLPAATTGARIRSLWQYAQLRAQRTEQVIPDVTGLIGLEHGHEALHAGPCIVTFPHLGAFEAAASLLHEHYPDRDHHVVVVTDDIHTAHAPGRILGDRYGWRTVSIYRPGVGTTALRTLIDGGILLVSSDVCPPNQLDDAATIAFLGREVRLPSGPARLALATGAVILPVATYRDREACHVRIEPPLYCDSRLNVTALTQDLADVMSRLICRAPDEWYPAFPLIAA